MAGTGKSTIARNVAQLYADKAVLSASFFFKRGERDHGSTSRFFTTIAAQLVAKEAALAAPIQAIVKVVPASFGKALKEQFERLTLEPLHKLTGDPNNPRT